MVYVDIDLGHHWFGKGLLPDGTKPLPEPLSTSHWWDSVLFTNRAIAQWMPKLLFCMVCLKIIGLLKMTATSPRGNEFKFPFTLVCYYPPSWIQWTNLREGFLGFTNPELVPESEVNLLILSHWPHIIDWGLTRLLPITVCLTNCLTPAQKENASIPYIFSGDDDDSIDQPQPRPPVDNYRNGNVVNDLCPTCSALTLASNLVLIALAFLLTL